MGAGSSSSESESSDSEEEKGSSKQSSDEDDQPIMEQIKSRVESQDNPQHHTSDEDDNNGMDMDMTNDDHPNDSPPPTRAPIRLPGLESKFKSHSRSNSPAFTQRDPEKRSRKVASVFQEDEDEVNQPEKIKKRKTKPERKCQNVRRRA